ncbi:unnamed protein product [Clavelina lepadiformis]|uniref:Raptor N-terminal CASPase-like domain-containing protein n=1 Tax=Clavelina lepadiformis TaxID=159417 RepID=A0ABP0EV35_CLALP
MTMGPKDNGSKEQFEDDEEVLEINSVIDKMLHVPIAYQEKRHLEKISGAKIVAESWRLKERMKTVSVALVLCLNVGVDPPDVVKTSPCARRECWIDPLMNSPQKALESIGNSIQKQYERWQPRARYKQSLDPTVEDVKRLCTSLRRNAKEERVLLHYNGHGVPRPTANGEIWVFNKNYTQYIPLSIYDLQSWMGSPSIFVYDCSCAGLIVSSFQSFAEQREQDFQINSLHSPSSNSCDAKNCIQLAACSASQLLPMNPELPADLFTTCLTTPIKIALQWFCHQRQGSLAPGVTLDLIEKIPGRLNDRRTPLGELNWIFTAITDTIAWNILPRDLFQKLFRQDLLVASLFRNFLLAERIMRSYRCTPVSSPPVPATFRHPMWAAWDHAVDVCLSQLPQLLSDDSSNYAFQNSQFFAQHLTAFEVWLSFGIEQRDPPEQLPIVLQVLLSQVHRLRALDLLGRFLDLGPWAVSLALSVGIFPYVLKLLQSQAKELRPLLVFIWAKILAVDSTCQSDLVKDGGHQYFLRALQDPQMSASRRTMAAFVLAEIVNGNSAGQEACLQRNVVSICLDQLDDEIVMTTPKLKQWVSICLGRVWTNYDEARWRGVRDQAHERLYELLDDPQAEVRAAAVYALGTFVDNQPEAGSDHAAHVNQAVGATLAPLQRREASVLVRCELASALQRLVSCYDSSFAAIAFRFVEEEKNLDVIQEVGSKTKARTAGNGSVHQVTRSNSRSSFDHANPPANYLSMMKQSLAGDVSGLSSSSDSTTQAASGYDQDTNLSAERLNRLRKISFSGLPSIVGSSYSSVNANIWKVLLSLAADPHPNVSALAKCVVAGVMERVALMAKEQNCRYLSESGSPRPRRRGDSENYGDGLSVESSSPSQSNNSPLIPIQLTPYSRTRKSFWKGPDRSKEVFRASDVPSTSIALVQDRLVSTQFCSWSTTAFFEPLCKETCNEEKEELIRQKRHSHLEKLLLNRIEIDVAHQKLDMSRLGDQQFFNKNPQQPVSLLFHPHNNNLLVADRTGINVWEWECGQRKQCLRNNNPTNSSISSMHFINEHQDPLLLVGSDDGCVRIWKNPCRKENQNPELVAAWQAISDIIPSSRSSGLVTTWDQSNLHIYIGGDSRHIQLWDTTTERKEQEFLTGADSCVTTLDFSGNLLAAGCGDGSVRMFDTRDRPRHKAHPAHNQWIVNTTFLEKELLLTASELGDVKMWDIRKMSGDPYRTIKVVRTGGIRHVGVHPNLHIIACGSADHSVSFLGLDGEDLGTVKYYEGFLGQRLGRITCMAFHPLLANLAVGTADCFLTVYSGESKSQS